MQESLSFMSLTTVCVESENAGNLGAIARAMGNFDLDKLILINPKVDPNCDEAIHRAKHAKDILKKAVIKKYDYFEKKSKSSLFKDFEYVIASTSVLGRDYNLPRLPLSPEKLFENIDSDTEAAVVIGRDGSGQICQL